MNMSDSNFQSVNLQPGKDAASQSDLGLAKLEVKNLDFTYQNGHRVLKSVNMNIRKNAVTAFIGPSGCGKSTLLRTFNRMYDLYPGQTVAGEILLDATAGSDAGIDVVSSEYATVAAEQTALENLTRVVADRIVTSLAVRLRKGDIDADPKPADNSPQPKR